MAQDIERQDFYRGALTGKTISIPLERWQDLPEDRSTIRGLLSSGGGGEYRDVRDAVGVFEEQPSVSPAQRQQLVPFTVNFLLPPGLLAFLIYHMQWARDGRTRSSFLDQTTCI